MNPAIREQIRFVLEDDNELMRVALEPESDLDEENKQMNRELIRKHEQILSELDAGRRLTKADLQLIQDANGIHLNDKDNLGGHHEAAVALNEWLKQRTRSNRQEAGADDLPERPAFDDEGRCPRCGSRVSFADVTDTLVFVGDEIVKRYDGDITNRNCVRCTYPRQYDDFKHFDDGDKK